MKELDALLSICSPRKTLFLAFDGPAPIAKLIIQRERRLKKRCSASKLGTGDSTRQTVSSLEFTPGVDLMYRLLDVVQFWVYTRLQGVEKLRNVRVFLSGPDVPGEGELKIIDYCRRRFRDNPATNESFVVVGGDADIILQGLTTVVVRNFFVLMLKSPVKGGGQRDVFFSVWELTRSLERRFLGEAGSARIDLVLLAILTGNGTSFHTALFAQGSI